MIFIYLGHEKLFVFFLCFNLFTDFLDGWVARTFNQVTEIGAIIDSFADTATYFMAFAGIIAFKWDDFRPYSAIILIFIVLLVIVDLYPLVKFGKFPGYHTYSAKVGGYCKGIFFIILFVFGFYKWLFLFIMITGVLIFLEGIAITAILKEPKSDVKGIWWVMRNK